MSDGLCFLPATELAVRLRARELSAVEVMEAHLAQIERVNPQVNAIVTLVGERALAEARMADQGPPGGVLHGLPVAHKDLNDTAGIRTTYGSPIYRRWIPAESSLIVERLHEAGAIAVGKTNVPEFGAGSQTFNEVFGATRNPYALDRTCGGSSGGAAVALACGLVPIADGSDMGGSLRNPASFCNVVGLRPSPGRVPTWPTESPWSLLSVDGPMGRTVADIALQLQAIAGPDRRCPLSLAEPGATFATPLERDLHGVRVAWSDDAGGLPVDPAVPAALAPARRTLEDLGCEVVDSFPDLAEAREIFQTLRAVEFAQSLAEEYDTERDRLKDTIRWNVALGRAVTAGRLEEATRSHVALREPGHAVHGRRGRARATDRPGTAVSGRDGVGDRDRRAADGDLHRLDAQLLGHHADRLPRDLGAGRLHTGGPAGRAPARRPPRRRSRPAPASRMRSSRSTRAGERRPAVAVEPQRP